MTGDFKSAIYALIQFSKDHANRLTDEIQIKTTLMASAQAESVGSTARIQRRRSMLKNAREEVAQSRWAELIISSAGSHQALEHCHPQDPQRQFFTRSDVRKALTRQEIAVINLLKSY